MIEAQKQRSLATPCPPASLWTDCRGKKNPLIPATRDRAGRETATGKSSRGACTSVAKALWWTGRLVSASTWTWGGLGPFLGHDVGGDADTVSSQRRALGGPRRASEESEQAARVGCQRAVVVVVVMMLPGMRERGSEGDLGRRSQLNSSTLSLEGARLGLTLGRWHAGTLELGCLLWTAWGARAQRQAVGVGLLQDPWLAVSDRAQPLCRAFQLQIHAAQFLVAGRLCRGCFNRFPAARCIGACLPARHGGALG